MGAGSKNMYRGWSEPTRAQQKYAHTAWVQSLSRAQRKKR